LDKKTFKELHFDYNPLRVQFSALPGLACDSSLSGIEVEASEMEEHVVLEALPVAVAA